MARAFCPASDHAAQDALFRNLAKPISHAAGVRAALTQGRMAARDSLARFVSLEAYENAGGHISRDLFDDAVVFLDDADLVRRLAAEKTDALREGLIAQGWGWAELAPAYGARDGLAVERLQPTRRPLSETEDAKRQAIAPRHPCA